MPRLRLRALIFSFAACAAVVLGLAAIPVASADTCTITAANAVTGQTTRYTGVTVPSGQTSQAQLLAALITSGVVQPGQIDLTAVTLTDACTATTTSTSMTTAATSSASTPTTSSSTSSTTSTAPASTSTTTSGLPTTSSTSSTTTTTTTSSSSSTTSSTSTTTTSTTASQPSATSSEKRSHRRTPKPQRASRHRSAKRHRSKTAARHVTTKAKHKSSGPSGRGVPNPRNPSYSVSLPGAPAVGVPNFFIDSFQVPPFLLPIYQAAGIEYNVPWEVLAAINQIETDYGRNLSVSSAGAVGWMQFLPSTWKRWGVDANGDGVADPYNPVDAIFTAARYLHAAGASQNLSRAIFAYNHATWYVQSVLLRAKLLGGIPSQLIGALTGLVQGHFPVAAPAKYADDEVITRQGRAIKGSNAADPVDSGVARDTEIFAKRGSPVIAVNDGKIVKLGHSAALGNYVELQDSTGNVYTYSHLGSISRQYAAPKPVRITRRDIASELATPKVKAPSGAATAGQQTPSKGAISTAAVNRELTAENRATARAGARSGAGRGSAKRAAAAANTAGSGVIKERLFAQPARSASYAAGGKAQLSQGSGAISSFDDYFADTLHLARGQYTLKRLQVGSIVIGGTILGRIGGPSQNVSSHLTFAIQPAGRGAPHIDPKPILDGWKLLQATAIYRANDIDPFWGSGERNPTVGQVLLMSKQQLTARVLTDPHVRIYNCGRRDIQAGTIDRRVLAVIEYLSASGLDPTVSGLACDASPHGRTGVDEAGSTGESVDISAINGIPILGHQGPGSITEIAVRRLLALQGSMAPDEVISDTRFKGASNALALPDHLNRIQVSYVPAYGANRKLSDVARSYLKPGQWERLIEQIGRIPEPSVPLTPSRWAIRDTSRR